ncbi:MAG: tRNA (adenosine(37)-N6)-threonylcarbamoyltransferase complex transferase subunit TsaD [bacterium]|nr:tRNA (adenosine(37)-N6)-threonylcarbamoyltransferase complex transferase subunit TsaD [bacterium]
MLCLAVETSCDETSAAVVEDGTLIRANIISSQVKLHSQYGGVVPELASRRHVEKISAVVDRALAEASLSLSQIDLIGTTVGPGLVGALLVGLSYAKALAYGAGIPCLGVHHIEGHIHAAGLDKDVPYPFLALVVSGGHTELIEVRAFGDYTVLGKTRDDAAGEAFDKVAKMMGLGYPGGPVLDRLGAKGDESFVRFPRAMLSEGSLDFSFSGLKTSVLNYLMKNGWGAEGEGAAALKEHLPDIAASFQSAVVEVLAEKAMVAMERHGFTRLVLAGGVAANRSLRKRLEEAMESRGYALHAPPPILCTDNAAMIGRVASHYYERGVRDPLDLNARASLPLPSRSAQSG